MVQYKRLKILRLPIVFLIGIVSTLIYYNYTQDNITDNFIDVILHMIGNNNISWDALPDQQSTGSKPDKFFKAIFKNDKGIIKNYSDAELLCEESLNAQVSSSTFGYLKFGSYNPDTDICRFSSTTLDGQTCE